MTHVCVDKARLQVPVSGTLVRADVHAARSLLPPIVYASFVKRVALLGGESTGKTTLAHEFAARHATTVAAEYGRDHWIERAGVLTLQEMLHIAQGQVKRETQAALRAHRWLFCDTTPLSTSLYSRHLFGQVVPHLAALAQRHYDHVFVCAPDFGFVQDGTRVGAEFSRRQHRWTIDALTRAGTAFHVLSGAPSERIRTVESVLSAPTTAALPAAHHHEPCAG